MRAEGGEIVDDAALDARLPAPRGRRRIDRSLAIGLTVLVLLPLLVALVVRIGRPYVPVGDIGTIDLRVRSVWSANVPLVGPYSRYGWSHPGPLFFYLLAVPSGLFGGAPWAIMVGGLLLQAIAVGWTAWLAWRRGGLALVALAMSAMALVYATLPREALLTPWNPYVPVPFFVLFVFQLWLVATGNRKLLPGAVLVAVFLVGTHVGYAVLVVAGLAVVAAYAILDGRRGHARWREWKRPALYAGGIAVLAAIPVLVDLVTNSPTNIGELVRYFTHPHAAEPAVGLHRAAELIAAEFKPPFEWLGAQEYVDYFSGGVVPASLVWLLVPVLLLAFAFLVARRRGNRELSRYGVLVVALLAGGIVASSRITGEPFPYLFKWRPVLAVAVVVAGLGALAVVLAPHVQARGEAFVRTVLASASAVVIVVTIGGLALDVARHPTPVKDLEDATVALTKSLEARGAPRQPVLTRFDTDSGAQLQRGVFDALARAGFPVRVDPDLAYEFGDQFAATPDDVGAVWWFADSGVPLIELGGLPGAKVIASYSPLSASEEAEAQELQRQLYDTLVAAGRADLAPQLDGRFVNVALRDVPGIDQQATERLAALNQAVYDKGSCRCGVVALPPRDAPVTVRDISAAAAGSASG